MDYPPASCELPPERPRPLQMTTGTPMGDFLEQQIVSPWGGNLDRTVTLLGRLRSTSLQKRFASAKKRSQHNIIRLTPRERRHTI